MNIKYPKNQTTWLQYIVNDTPTYLVTSDISRTIYTLHKINSDGSLTKLKTSKDPQFQEIHSKTKGGES